MKSPDPLMDAKLNSKTHLLKVPTKLFKLENTQSTQSGNDHFLAEHSVMRVNSAHAGEGVGCPCTPFHYIYLHVQCWGVRFS